MDSKTDGMTIYDVLLEDHRVIRALLERIDATPATDESVRARCFLRLVTRLAVHAEVEDALFYGLLRDLDESRPLALEGHEQHAVIARVLDEMACLTPDDEVWCAKFRVLKQVLERHLEAEERETFALARRLLSADRAVELAAEIALARDAASAPDESDASLGAPEAQRSGV